jgi:hypothetical protein
MQASLLVRSHAAAPGTRHTRSTCVVLKDIRTLPPPAQLQAIFQWISSILQALVTDVNRRAERRALP